MRSIEQKKWKIRKTRQKQHYKLVSQQSTLELLACYFHVLLTPDTDTSGSPKITLSKDMWLSWPHRNHGAILPMWGQANGKNRTTITLKHRFFLICRSIHLKMQRGSQVQSVDIKMYQVG